MLVECTDREVVLGFCSRDPIRFRQLIHDADPPCPAWNAAMDQYYAENDDEETGQKAVFYVDSLPAPSLLVSFGKDYLRAEGVPTGLCLDQFLRVCDGVPPKGLITSDEKMKTALGEIFGRTDWMLSKQYTTTNDTFRQNLKHSVRLLTPEDGPAWKRFAQRNSGEGIVVREAGGSGAGDRDFQFMCQGLPVEFHAVEDDGEIAGFLSVNLMTADCDEISALFVEPAHRRRGIAHSLLAAATERILTRGRLPGYFAGSAGDDLDRMLTGIGYHLVSNVWTQWSW